MSDDSRAEVEACFDELRRLVDKHVVAGMKWYETHTRSPWILFRVIGTAMIVLSVSLPVISSVPFPNPRPIWLPPKDLLVSAIALVVAVLSGLGTFFQWQDAWRVNKQAELQVRHLLGTWELALVEARQWPDASDQTRAAIAATRELFSAAARVDSSNTEGYFKNVRFPEKR